ncbi:MAG: polysaccharide deacetylase family protein [Endomicrobium sp.]|jgi:peptidoglycan/xylan/chitin deacetylase (PgdA/CDA1 family)|nr:polysaccharide deacetylase family protein [Endomicrobium sp.]
MFRLNKILISITIIALISSGISLIYGRDFYTEGSINSKKVALTFDDGPGASTNAILEILKSKNVKATFFLLGSRAKANPNDARRIAQEGHEIGNHTYHHINFFSYKKDDKESQIESELVSSGKIIEEVSGVKPRLVRFPYGYSRPDSINIAKKYGYTVINWSFGCDWQKKIQDGDMLKKYKKAISGGAIFLLHDAPRNAKSLKFLSKLIDEIKNKGFEIVTVSELLGL